MINPAVGGAVWTVDDHGLGIRLIQQAIDLASSGDTIMVRSGTYYEHLVVDKSLSIIGEDQNTTIVDGGGNWTIVEIFADNVTVRGFTLQHAGVGVLLEAETEGTVLAKNRISFTITHAVYGDRCGTAVIEGNSLVSNSGDGIFLYASKPSIIDNNVILSNGKDGMRIRYTSNSTVTANFVQGNTNGIYLYSDEDPLRQSSLDKNNSITDNHVLNNSCGIRIEHFGTGPADAENKISDNFIAYNSVGLNVYGSNQNTFVHNNFVDNSKQIAIAESLNNTWSDGYYSGGNYWSDHNGTDVCWGPNQNNTGTDGVADMSYMISENPGDEDMYPFMLPNEWLAALQVDVPSPSNITYRSEDVQMFINLNKPAWLSYSLDGEPNVTIVENQVLTELKIGTHNITVQAHDTIGNEASCNVTFNVTFLADLNLDFAVSIVDVSIVAYSFRAAYGSERWNADADLDNNLAIDIIDVTLVAMDYGKKG
jgi:parallel beta-helix repeat protein